MSRTQTPDTRVAYASVRVLTAACIAHARWRGHGHGRGDLEPRSNTVPTRTFYFR